VTNFVKKRLKHFYLMNQLNTVKNPKDFVEVISEEEELISVPIWLILTILVGVIGFLLGTLTSFILMAGVK
jgi:hypothetical protein